MRKKKKKQTKDTNIFDRRLVDIITAEMQIINRVLDEHGIDGGVYPRDVVISPAYLTYGLSLGKGVKSKTITNLQAELSTAITRHRHKRINTRIEEIPPTIEVPHPSPKPLLFAHQDLQLPPHTVLLGQTYHNGQAQVEAIPFADFIHGLIVGMTGSGKSVQMTTMLLALCEHTPPDELNLHLIDLKNDDLIPLRRLPHVKNFAGELKEAEQLIARVYQLQAERVQAQETNPMPRHVIVVDEFHMLADSKQTLKEQQAIISLGRSMNIHIIAATQHPLEKVVSSILKANFPHRLVGAVTSKEASKVASGRAGVGAELLPGKGAFLKNSSGNVTRYQTFFIDKAEVPKYVQQIINLYPEYQPPGSKETTLPEVPPAILEMNNRVKTLANKQEVKNTFTQFFDPKAKKLKYGGASKLFTAMFGPMATRGGSNWYVLQQVILYLIGENYEDG